MCKDLMRAVLITTLKRKFPYMIIENGFYTDTLSIGEKKFRVTYLDNYIFKVESIYFNPRRLNFVETVDCICEIVG